MFRSIKSSLFSLLLVIAFASCEKEVSVENGGNNNGSGSQSGTAVWTLDGSPLLCTTPLISGDYVVNTALDISNTVVITATVTTLGTYTISTGLINGIQFEGSGTFSATGTQTITLFGTGTPVAAMTSNYIPGTNGCTFSITATTGTVTPVTGLYYAATIDGTPYRVDLNGINGYHGDATSFGSGEDMSLGSSITTTTIPRPAGTTSFEIDKGVLHSYSTVNNLTFKNFFATGPSPYGIAPDDGVEIIWGDEAGNVWTTDGDQTGSNFTISSVADEPGQSVYTVRVTATFNCKLYDGAGNTKTLTAGTYVGLFSKI